MAHSGSKKGTKEWLQFQSEDKPAKSLGTKLVEEQRKRKAAEKEVERLKKEIARLGGVINSFTGSNN